MIAALKVLTAARGEIGYHEGRSNGHWNNNEKYAAEVPGLAWANNQPWCATFVCWCFNKAGLLDLLPTVSASCNFMADAWKKAGRWSEYPAIGAQIFYGTASNLEHTGIVIGYDDTTVTTVEGNTNTDGSAEGDGVYRKVHRRTDPWVVGYGYPKYAEGIRSADPAYARELPRPKGPLTRGGKVDHALKDLRASKGRGRRGRLLAAAKAALRKIARFPKKR